MPIELVNFQGPRFVGASGSSNCKIAFVGEAPGQAELAQRAPFVGPAGMLLRRLMTDVGINPSDCYFTNVVKEKPNQNDISDFIKLSHKGAATTEAYRKYEEDLYVELKECKANVIVALGNIALYALTRMTDITKRRGSLYRGVTGHKVLACIHPSAGFQVYLWQHFMKHDLRRALEESETPDLVQPERTLRIAPSYSEAMTYLEECRHLPSVAFDIEISMKTGHMTCFSFAKSPWDAMSIPLVNGGDYFSVDQEQDILRMTAEVLEDPDVNIVGQNIVGFDSIYMFENYGIQMTNVDDTMIAHAILYPEFPKGLDFLTSVYTKEPYYKDDGKTYMRHSGNIADFWRYNAKDSAMCAEIMPKLVDELELQGNYETYKRQAGLILPLTYMQVRGIRVDTEGLKQASKDSEKQLEELNAKFRAMTNGVNPRSTKELRAFFYGTKGIKPHLKRGTGAVTCDEEALRRISKAGHEEARILLQIRKVDKMHGTYYEMTFDDDNRMRCSFNPVGTMFGRISSRKTMRGTGGNFQNMPPAFKRYLQADPGYVVYEVDLSKAENACVAYFGPEPTMMQAFELGIDLHAQTASLILGKPIEEVSDEDGSSSFGSGEYSERFWGKKANHAFNYGFGYRSFSMLYELPERESKFIHDRYHAGYPGIKANYWRLIQEMLGDNRTIINPFGRHIRLVDRWGEELFKQGYAALPQSTVADKINEHGLLFVCRNPEQFEQLLLTSQVHDSIVFQIPVAIGWAEHARMLLALLISLETPITFRGRTFVIHAEAKVGLSMGNYKKVKFTPTTPADQLAAQLEATYANLKS